MDWRGGLLVDYYDVYISCLDSHSDGTIHFRGSIGEQSDGMLNFFIRWRNRLIYILDGLRVSTFSANFHFWVNYSFKAAVYFKMCISLCLVRSHSWIVPVLARPIADSVTSHFLISCQTGSAQTHYSENPISLPGDYSRGPHLSLVRESTIT